jgi:hypothetical protein
MTLKFIGTEAEIGGKKLTALGQEFDLPAAEAKDAILGAGAETGYAGAVAALPADQFDALGFTDAELKRYAYPGARERAPEDCRGKLCKAAKALDEYRATIEKPAKKKKEAE